MPSLYRSSGTNDQSWYFAFLLIAITSLTFSSINFLTVGKFKILQIHRLIILLLLVAFVLLLTERSRLRLYRLDLAILIFLSVMVMRLVFDVFSPYPITSSVTVVAQLIFMCAFYFALGSYPANQWEQRTILRVWLVLVLLVSVYGFYQMFARNFGLPLANLSIGSWSTRSAPLFGYQRPTSIFTEPTKYSNFVLPAYVFMTYLYMKGQSSALLFESKARNAALVGFIWMNYFLIVSLGGYVTVAATAGIATLFERRVRRAVAVMTPVVAVSVVLAFNFGEGIDLVYAPAKRIVVFVTSLISVALGDGVVSGSLGVRMVRFYWSLLTWGQNPLFGIGINNITYMTHFTRPSWFGTTGLETIQPVTHSIVGFILSSAGLIGIIAYGLIYFYIYQDIERVKSLAASQFNVVVIVGLGYAVLVDALLGFFSMPLVHPLHWFLFGLLSITLTTAENEELPPD